MTSSDEFEALPPEELSKIIPGFRFGTILAAGPHSAVYSAIQTSLDRQVALRLYSPAASSDPERVRVVETMTRSMARLKHPNLIGLYDSGTRDGMIYVVMEFVAGKSLARSLGGNPIDHTQARAIFSGICEGLAHAHQYEITHGKLTADDVLLNSDAEPKIGNFTGEDFKKGKVSDIVAVGRILYLMLTGVEDSPRSVEPSVLRDSPKELDEIWARCTKRDHPDAFLSVAQILHALNKPRSRAATAAPARVVRAAVPQVAARSIVTPPLGEKPPQSEKPPATVAYRPGTQWTLARNLVIIVILVIAIVKVWGLRQQKEREIQIQHQAEVERAKVEAETRRQEALRKRLARQQMLSRQPEDPADQTPAKVQEINEASLYELRAALADGKRDVLPIGSVRRADSVYLLVRETLSWPEAQWFAEQYGAHLAIPDESADLMWLQTISDGEPFWLGAGKSGRLSWQLLDGRPWQPSKEPVGLGRYLAADKFGFLRAAGDQVRLPFILQWKMDGSNPGRLEPMLAATAATLSTGNAVYPPGTHLVAERAYLVVARDVDWEEANRLAALSGGHLAAVSDAAETVHLGDIAKKLPPERFYWIGARRNQQGWAWETGEAWRDIPIVGSAEDAGAALSVSAVAKWHAADPASALNGFIIEWSRDAESVSTSGSSQPALEGPAGAAVGLIDAQAKQLLQTALTKRTKELKDNASKMESDLGIIARNMPSTLQRDWVPHIDALKKLIVGVRVPDSATYPGIQLNEQMTEVATYATTKQQSIDAEFNATANLVRGAYQKRLRDIMTKALEANDRKTVLDLKPKLDASEQLESWLTELGVSTAD